MKDNTAQENQPKNEKWENNINVNAIDPKNVKCFNLEDFKKNSLPPDDEHLIFFLLANQETLTKKLQDKLTETAAQHIANIAMFAINNVIVYTKGCLAVPKDRDFAIPKDLKAAVNTPLRENILIPFYFQLKHPEGTHALDFCLTRIEGGAVEEAAMQVTLKGYATAAYKSTESAIAALNEIVFKILFEGEICFEKATEAALMRRDREDFVFPTNPEAGRVLDVLTSGRFVSPFQLINRNTNRVDHNLDPVKETFYRAIVCDDPGFKAHVDALGPLLATSPEFIASEFTKYLERTFKGAEGLKCFLGILSILDEKCATANDGRATLETNDLMKCLGYRKATVGVYNPAQREQIIKITDIIVNLKFEFVEEKEGGKVRAWVKMPLFNDLLQIGEAKKRSTRVLGKNGSLEDRYVPDRLVRIIQPNPLWYKDALRGRNGQAPQFIMAPKKLIKLNAKKHAVAIRLGVQLLLNWRRNQGDDVRWKLETLLQNCSLKVKGAHAARDRKLLEKELNFMVSEGLLGDWSIEGSNEKSFKSTTDPYSTIVILQAPQKTKKTIDQIRQRAEGFLPTALPEEKKPLSKEDFEQIFKKSGLSVRKFAESLGIEPSTISRIRSGQRKISPELSYKVLERYGTGGVLPDPTTKW